MGRGGIRPAAASGSSNNNNDDDAADAEVVAGMWVGESWPSPELLAIDPTVPTNPIRWSLALDPSHGIVSAFGAGYFDDAGDIPGQSTLWFTLRGTFDAETRGVKISKTYERPVPEGTEVEYSGKLHALNGKPEITGTWVGNVHDDEQPSELKCCSSQSPSQPRGPSHACHCCVHSGFCRSHKWRHAFLLTVGVVPALHAR